MRILPVLLLALGALPAAAQSRDRWTWTGDVPAGGTLEIRNVNGLVRTERGGDRVEIVATKRATRGSVDVVEIRVELDGDDVIVCALWPNHSAGSSGCHTDGMRPRRDDWKVKDQVEVEFLVRVPRTVRFVGSTVNGDVEARGLGADARIATVNGSALVETAGTAEASSVNGDVTARLGRLGDARALKFTSVNGDVRVALPADAGFDLDASTVNGDIQSDFPVTVSGRLRRQQLRGRIGGGGPRLGLTTVNGGVRVSKS